MIPPGKRLIECVGRAGVKARHLRRRQLMAEPGTLPFRILSCFDDHALDGGIQRACAARAIERLAHDTIAAGGPRRCVVVDRASQLFDFLHKSVSDHLMHAVSNSFDQYRPRIHHKIPCRC